MPKIDKYDRAILSLLQKDCRKTSDEISAVVALSATAVQRRIKRLHESGVILAERAIVNPMAVGRPLTIVVQATLDKGRADTISAFKRQIQSIPEVQQCYYVTGEHDFILIITTADMAEYERLTHTLFFGGDVIKKFQSLVVMESVKVGLELPLDFAGES